MQREWNRQGWNDNFRYTWSFLTHNYIPVSCCSCFTRLLWGEIIRYRGMNTSTCSWTILCVFFLCIILSFIGDFYRDCTVLLRRWVSQWDTLIHNFNFFLFFLPIFLLRTHHTMENLMDSVQKRIFNLLESGALWCLCYFPCFGRKKKKKNIKAWENRKYSVIVNCCCCCC